MTKEIDKAEQSRTEEINVKGSDLVDKIKKLVEQGNVRRLILKNTNGDILLEIPLTAGAMVAGTLMIVAPVLTALGALAAMVAEVRVEVVRSEDSE